jgi:hypothetical protein
VSRARIDQLRAAIERISKAGAITCAPRELALARAHYDFAQTELLQGDADRAQQHLTLAEQNLGAAQVLTPDRGCKSTTPNADEVSAIPGSSSADEVQVTKPLEADGGSIARPRGTVKTHVENAARDLTLTAYERICVASALTASQMTYAANDRHASEASDPRMTTVVEQATLTPRAYGDRRLDVPMEMSYVVLSIGDLSPVSDALSRCTALLRYPRFRCQSLDVL